MTNDQSAVPPTQPTPVEPAPGLAAAPVAPPPPAGYYTPGDASGYAAGYYAPQPARGLAIASMVLGIVGVFFSFGYGFGLFPSIAAVITGHLARKRQPYARGFWLAGLICGYVGLGISVLWIAGIILFAVFAISNSGTFSTGSFSNT